MVTTVTTVTMVTALTALTALTGRARGRRIVCPVFGQRDRGLARVSARRTARPNSGRTTDPSAKVLARFEMERDLLLATAVPSLRHELLLRVFRDSAELACQLARSQLHVAAEVVGRSVPADLSSLVPVQLLADHVFAFYPRERAHEAKPPAELVVVIEVQRRRDDLKRYRWPSYVANAANAYQCEAMLLVVTDEPSVARWAEGPFGTSQLQLRPLVFCTAEIHQMRFSDDALSSPALDVLRAMADPREENVRAGLASLAAFSDEVRELVSMMMWELLPATDPAELERQRIKKERLRTETKELLRKMDELRVLHKCILDLLSVKDSELREEHERSIRQMWDPEVVEQLWRDLLRARDAAQARAAIEHAISFGLG